jgi:ribosomal protein S18 acetylase RimI-like enzyme
VHVETWRRAYAGIVSADFLAGLSIERRCQRWRQSLESPEPGTRLFVCTRRRSIIAFCSCGAVREDATARRGEVYAIYVVPTAQGCGVGRALMRAAAAHLLAQGMTSMLLWVLKDNLPARQFYGSLGGKVLEEKPITIGDQSLIEVAYAWDDLNTLAKE